MIGVEVTFLTGRYVASAHNRRDAHEWPPHWARMFSALVAAWGEAGEDGDEAALLRGIEDWGHPHIAASEASRRQVSVHWVPVNDASVVGLSLQASRSAKLDAALQRVADVADATPAKQETAARKVSAARDVATQVARAGRTPPATALELLPEHRVRQERRYPSVTPQDPRVLFVWPDRSTEAVTARTLDGLLARVTRLGHSSSMVSCRAVTSLPPDGPAVRFVPDDDPDVLGAQTLRSIGAGQLDALVTAHRRHRGSGPRSMPQRSARYRDRTVQPDDVPAPARSLQSGRMIVFERASGPRLPAIRAVDVARGLRGALMAHAPDPLPEVLSGHRPEPGRSGPTRPSERPHLAYVPLPFVGHPHATGHLLGAALVLPRDVADTEQAQVEAAVLSARRSGQAGDDLVVAPDAPLRLTLGRAGVVELIPVLDEYPSHGLRAETWTRPARMWHTVTPIALPRHPGRLGGASGRKSRRAWDSAADEVARACRHVQLPDPVQVHVQLAPLLAGSRHVREFASFGRGNGRDRQVRALVHAEVAFADPVAGPLLLGAGRYLGLGLMRPVVEA